MTKSKPKEKAQTDNGMDFITLLANYNTAKPEQIANVDVVKSLSPYHDKSKFKFINDNIVVGDVEMPTANSIGVITSSPSNQQSNLAIFPLNGGEPFLLHHFDNDCLSIGNGEQIIVAKDQEQAFILQVLADTANDTSYTIVFPLSEHHFISLAKAYSKLQQVLIFDMLANREKLEKDFKTDNVKLILTVDIIQDLTKYNLNQIIHNSINDNLVDTTIVELGTDDSLLQERKAHLQLAVERLAKLDEMELHLSLKGVAGEFGITQKALLSFVSQHQQGDLVKETEPASETVTGKQIYQELYTLIDSFMVIDEPYKVAFVLWVIFSYLVDISEIAPIAWITSPEKQCGKSTLLGLFERVVYRPFTANNITQAVLYRVMERYKPCLIVDEIDTSLKDKGELLGIINAGYSRHASQTPRINNDKGGEIEAFNAYGAKVFAGIGEMQGTFASRAIRFELRRKHNGDKAVKRLNIKTLPREQTDITKTRIKRWCDDNVQLVQVVDVPLLGINDRDFDNWYILLQIAKVLGVYDKAVNACLAICGKDKEMGTNEMLLHDIRNIMVRRDKIKYADLLNLLNDDELLAWRTYNGNSPLATYQLSKKLNAFGIKTKSIRLGQENHKGYEKSQFVPVFERYLPPLVIDDEIPFI